MGLFDLIFSDDKDNIEPQDYSDEGKVNYITIIIFNFNSLCSLVCTWRKVIIM